MKCPRCGLFNPDTALRCDCGYDFPSGEMKDSYLSGTDTSQHASLQNSTDCQNCGSSNIEQGYDFRLCAACRDTLAARPLPSWSRYFFGVVAVLLIVALAGLPDSLAAGIAYQRGRKAEAEGNWTEAAAQYSIVAQRFPDSTLAQARVGITHFRNNEYEKAAAAFERIAGRKTDADLAKEVNAAIEEMEKKSK